MPSWISILPLLLVGQSSAQAFLVNYYPPAPTPTYQLGQGSSYYQPGVPINIQQLGAQPTFNPALQQTNIQGIPIGNQQLLAQQSFQTGVQQGSVQGIPINGFQNPIGNPVQQLTYPSGQQFIPQVAQVGYNQAAPGPITFPR